ncbi:MAG: LysR family transcriptional regulator [Lacisediminihabitans sp.]
MDLRQMEYFVALAEEQQFTRAAELTMVSQSGLSASIRSLEDELQTRLFTRTTRKVQLTAAGAALLPHARSLLAQATAGRDAVKATLGTLGGQLRVGSEQCLGVLDVSELLERFHRCYPRVEIEFEQDGSQSLLSRLRSGDLDVAFIAGGSDPDSKASTRLSGLEQIPIASEPLVLLCHPDNPLASQRRVSWSELEDQVFVDFKASWAVRLLNDQAFSVRGLTRRVGFTVNDVHTMLDLIQRGLAIALVPRPIASKPQAAGLHKSSLADVSTPDWVVTAVMGSAGRSSERSAPLAAKLLELLPVRDAGLAS